MIISLEYIINLVFESDFISREDKVFLPSFFSRIAVTCQKHIVKCYLILVYLALTRAHLYTHTHSRSLPVFYLPSTLNFNTSPRIRFGGLWDSYVNVNGSVLGTFFSFFPSTLDRMKYNSFIKNVGYNR